MTGVQTCALPICIVAFRDECAKAVGESDIIICIENSNGYTTFQREALNLLLQSPVFGLTFDIGHNYGISGMDEPFILEHADRLCHMHMHDALGKKDHLALGTGELDLQRKKQIQNKNNSINLIKKKKFAGMTQYDKWEKQKNKKLKKKIKRRKIKII